MKRTYLAYVVLIIIAMIPSQALAKLSDQSEMSLETKHIESISTQKGKAFEISVGKVIDGSTLDVSKCLTPQVDLTKPLVIYYEIRKSGKLGDVAIFPNSTIAPCLKKQMINYKFPSPSKTFVGKLRMSFVKDN